MTASSLLQRSTSLLYMLARAVYYTGLSLVIFLYVVMGVTWGMIPEKSLDKWDEKNEN